MSLNNCFELYKIRREIRRNGTEFVFYREGKNDYGEPTEPEVTGSIKGFYYEHSPHILDAYVILTGEANASYRTKKMPVLLCPWEDLFKEEEVLDDEGQVIETKKVCIVQPGDYVMMNGYEIHVTGVRNVMEWNLVCHISFEEVDYGSQSLLPGGEKSD